MSQRKTGKPWLADFLLHVRGSFIVHTISLEKGEEYVQS